MYLGIAESGYETVFESRVDLSPIRRNHSVIQQRLYRFVEMVHGAHLGIRGVLLYWHRRRWKKRIKALISPGDSES
jgi:nitrate reductase gamma subunit